MPATKSSGGSGRSRSGRSRPAVLSDIGSFGGLFALDDVGIADPVLVASADGVGTKLRLAFMTGDPQHDRRRSRQPLRQRHPRPRRAAAVLPRLPGDRAGSILTSPCRSSTGWRARAARTAARFSAARRPRCRGSTPTANTTSPASSSAPSHATRLIDGRAIRAGDVLIGLPSSGLHTNGYSLARRIVFDMAGMKPDDARRRIGIDGRRGAADAASLVPAADRVRCWPRAGVIKGMAHITGGGITDNLPRILPDGLHAVVDRRAWDVPPVFSWLQQAGRGARPRTCFGRSTWESD